MKTNPNPNPTPQSGQGTSQALPIKLQFHAVTLRYCHLTIRIRILHSSYTLYMQTPHLVGLKLTHHAISCPFDPTWSTSWGLGLFIRIFMAFMAFNEQMKGCRWWKRTNNLSHRCFLLSLARWMLVRYCLIQTDTILLGWQLQTSMSSYMTLEDLIVMAPNISKYSLNFSKQGTIFYVWKARLMSLAEKSMKSITDSPWVSSRWRRKKVRNYNYSRDRPPPQSQKNPCAKTWSNLRDLVERAYRQIIKPWNTSLLQGNSLCTEA